MNGHAIRFAPAANPAGTMDPANDAASVATRSPQVPIDPVIPDAATSRTTAG